MSSRTWKGVLGRGLVYLGNYNLKGVLGFSYKWKIHSWKVKGVGELFNVLDDSFSWKWQLRGNCGELSCTWENWVFHWFMYSKQIYEPMETFGILLSPEITLLPTKPFLPYYPLEIPRVWTMGSKIISGFCWIFSSFLHTSLFSYVLAKVLFSRLQKDTSRS